MSSLILWSCTVPACPAGNFINDPTGRADHQAACGHAPSPGSALGWLWDRSGAA